MNADELKSTLLTLRDHLSSQQENIINDVLGDSGLRDTGKAPINFAEQASDEQEIDLMAERVTASSETLADIDEALDRIDAGLFNVCEECKGEIGERRLKVRPWSRLCVKCKQKHEAEEES